MVNPACSGLRTKLGGSHWCPKQSPYVWGLTGCRLDRTESPPVLRVVSLICLAVAATSPTLVLFTLNFTITNLPYVPDMGHPGSAKRNMTEEVLQPIVRAPACLLPTPPHPCPAPSTSPAYLPLIFSQLGSLFKNTSIGPLYSSCKLTSLRWDAQERMFPSHASQVQFLFSTLCLLPTCQGKQALGTCDAASIEPPPSSCFSGLLFYLLRGPNQGIEHLPGVKSLVIYKLILYEEY